MLKVPEVGVPRAGVTNVGLVDKTTLPEPVEVVTPVPPDATASVADNPAAVPVVFWFSVGTSAAWIAASAAFVPSERRYCPAVWVPVNAVMAAAAVV